MRSVRRAGVALALCIGLVGGVFLLPAVPVSSAAGYCNEGQVTFYKDITGGATRTYCYGWNDTDMASEPGLVMGKLKDGTYQDDWVDGGGGSRDAYSGITTVRALAGTLYPVCIYAGRNYTTFISRVDPGESETMVIWNDRVVSFYFKTSGSCVGS